MPASSITTGQSSVGTARAAIGSHTGADPNTVALALGLAPDALQAILAHGPWPQPVTPDPGNRASGQAAAVALGGFLFFDRRLSHDGRMACASCHVPEKGFTDGRARSLGHDDALARGDLKQAHTYPADALRGLQRFVGEGRCNLCHTGPAFTHGEFHGLGRPFMAAPGRPDCGRHGGVQAVLTDPYNRLGPWVDAPAQPSADDPAVRTRHLS